MTRLGYSRASALAHADWTVATSRPTRNQSAVVRVNAQADARHGFHGRGGPAISLVPGSGVRFPGVLAEAGDQHRPPSPNSGTRMLNAPKHRLPHRAWFGDKISKPMWCVVVPDDPSEWNFLNALQDRLIRRNSRRAKSFHPVRNGKPSERLEYIRSGFSDAWVDLLRHRGKRRLKRVR